MKQLNTLSEQIKILMIDSVLPELTVGVITLTSACECEPGNAPVFKHSPDRRSHDKHINILVRELLAETNLTFADLNYYAAVTGPGSWTGCRVGVAAVKGFNAAANKPVISLNTLDIISHGAQLPAALRSHSNIYFTQEYAPAAEKSENTKIVTAQKLESAQGYLTTENIGKEKYLQNIISLIADAVKNKKTTDAHTLTPLYVTDFEVKQ